MAGKRRSTRPTYEAMGLRGGTDDIARFDSVKPFMIAYKSLFRASSCMSTLLEAPDMTDALANHAIPLVTASAYRFSK